VEKLINDSENDCKQKQKEFKSNRRRTSIPYDRDKIKLASLELDSKRIELQGKRKLVFRNPLFNRLYRFRNQYCSL
jgi:hypothetical protein